MQEPAARGAARAVCGGAPKAKGAGVHTWCLAVWPHADGNDALAT